MQKSQFDIHKDDFVLFRNSTNEVDIISEEIAGVISNKEIKNFLDIGFGKGDLTKKIIDKLNILNTITIDREEFNEKINGNIKFFKEDWLEFICPHKFDFILCSHGLSYISFENVEVAIKKIYDNLEQEGRAVIIIYDNKKNWADFKKIFYPKDKLNINTVDFIRPLVKKYNYIEKIFYTTIHAKNPKEMIKIGRFFYGNDR